MQKDKKKETNHIETFEESGDIPPDRQGCSTVSEDILEFLKQGKSDREILEAFPSCMNRLDKIERARQTLLEDRYREEFRNLTVTYIWGTTGTGKTRGIMEKYGYRNVYRVTDYANPFDGYKCEDIIVFEEFRSDINLAGVTPSTVYSLFNESRNNVSIKTIKILCDGLNITLGEFFSTTEFDALEQEIE